MGEGQSVWPMGVTEQEYGTDVLLWNFEQPRDMAKPEVAKTSLTVCLTILPSLSTITN